MGTFSFGKKERLCSQTTIAELFKDGQSFKVFPVRVLMLPLRTAEARVQVLISVPKKRVRKAHDRNRVKRLLREAYRLNKSALVNHCEEHDLRLAVGFIYLSDRSTDFATLNEVMRNILNKVQEMVTAPTNSQSPT